MLSGRVVNFISRAMSRMMFDVNRVEVVLLNKSSVC